MPIEVSFGGQLERPIEIGPLLEKAVDSKRLRTLLVERGGLSPEEAASRVEELVAVRLEGAGRSVIAQMRDRLLEVFELRKQVTREYGNLAEHLRGQITAEQLTADRTLFTDLFKRLDDKLGELTQRNLNADIDKTKVLSVDRLLAKLSEAEHRPPTQADIQYYERVGLSVLRDDAHGTRATVARQLLRAYEEGGLSDAQLAELITRDNDRLAVEALHERNMRARVNLGARFEDIEEPYRLLPEQVLARHELRASILEMLPKGSRVRLQELPATPEFIAQAVAASRENEPFTMDVEFWIEVPGIGEFNPDGILFQKEGTFTFLERKQVLTTWNQSRLNAPEEISVMLRRHLEIARALKDTPFKGWDYSTNLQELDNLIAEQIGALHEPDASQFLHVASGGHLPPEMLAGTSTATQAAGGQLIPAPATVAPPPLGPGNVPDPAQQGVIQEQFIAQTPPKTFRQVLDSVDLTGASPAQLAELTAGWRNYKGGSLRTEADYLRYRWGMRTGQIQPASGGGLTYYSEAGRIAEKIWSLGLQTRPNRNVYSVEIVDPVTHGSRTVNVQPDFMPSGVRTADEYFRTADSPQEAIVIGDSKYKWDDVNLTIDDQIRGMLTLARNNGKPFVFLVKSGGDVSAGIRSYCAENGVEFYVVQDQTGRVR